LYEKHQAVYPRKLQAENCVIVGSFLYSHRDMQGKRLMEFMYHLSGYQITATWKEVDIIPEEVKDRLSLWHVESDKKDKKQVTRLLESIYTKNQRNLFPLGYKLNFLFNIKDSIGIHGSDKVQNLFDQQADLTKIQIYVQVPGVKGGIL
jgi:hypothetical protein